PFEHLVDRAAAQLHLEHFLLEALPAAYLARHEYIREKHHLDQHVARALARLAADTGHVERERAGGEAARPRQRLGGEQGPELVEGLDVRDGIGPRGASDRGPGPPAPGH